MRRRINILVISLMSIGILATGLLAHTLLKDNFVKAVERRLLEDTYLIRDLFKDGMDGDEKKLIGFINKKAGHLQVRITLIDPDGRVLADSERPISKLENHRLRPEVQKAYKGVVGFSQRFSESLGMDLYYVAIPLKMKGSTLHVLRTSLPLKNITSFNQQLLRTILLSAVFGLGIAILLGFRFLKIIINPIRDMSIASKDIANGRFGNRIFYESKDELGELAENFNKMSEELGKKIMEIKDQNIKNSAILSSMLNGVIAVDNHKHIMFINPAAEILFGFREDQIKGRHILEAFRNNRLDEQIQTLIEDNIQTTIEIEMHKPDHRILNLHANPILSSHKDNERIGVVIIIADVTEMRKLEFMRKDFVANVSHELKTPLTSIKGFIETLKNGAAENTAVRDKFLDIIDMETSRLSTLIEDLLVLSEIEKRSNIIEKKEINVVQAAEEVIDMLEEIAKKENVELMFSYDSVEKSLFGNRGWFKQMLINLIDNGIKYTGEDGHVWINLTQENDELIISIKDDGIGIPGEHIERLFERFYRVDKARSRNVGGTGLGLAIVKHVVLSLGGTINVSSKYGKGTTFVVKIPFAQ